MPRRTRAVRNIKRGGPRQTISLPKTLVAQLREKGHRLGFSTVKYTEMILTGLLRDDDAVKQAISRVMVEEL